MPFFVNLGNKFIPKRAPARRTAVNAENTEDLDDLVSDQRVVQLRLGGQEIVFDNGEWIPESGQSGTAHKTNQKLKKKMLELQEENNLLRLKCSILLNMLTQVTAENQLHEKELEKLRKTK